MKQVLMVLSILVAANAAYAEDKVKNNSEVQARDLRSENKKASFTRSIRPSTYPGAEYGQPFIPSKKPISAQ